MGALAKIHFNAGTYTDDTFGTWTGFESATDLTSVNLLNFDTGADTGWDVIGTDLDGKGSPGINAVGTGDADWVDEAIASYEYHWTSTVIKIDFASLDDTKTYTIKVFPSRDTADATRVGDYSIDNFTAFQTVDAGSGGNSTVIAEFANVSPVSGGITLDIRVSSGATYAYVNAIQIEEFDAPSGINILRRRIEGY